MKDFLNKFKIPTLLGLSLILVGIGVGVFLVLREQIFLSNAATSSQPENINVSNIEDSSVSISWQTSSASFGFITYGQNNPTEQTVLDDRDSKTLQLHNLHYVTLKNLLPKTTYQYKVVSGKSTSDTLKFTTGSTIDDQNGFRPIIGSVLADKAPLAEGVAFLSIADAVVQSSLIKNLGNFLIPVSQIRKNDLSAIYPLTNTTLAKVTVFSLKGQATVLFTIKQDGITLPALTVGQTLDLTTPEATSTPTPILGENLEIYDLNNDNFVNVNDYSLALKNKGKKVKSIRVDLKTDRIVDQSYLNELTKQISNQKP